MSPRITLSPGKICAVAAAAIFVFDVLDSISQLFTASRTWDFAGRRTAPLNSLRGFTLYVTPKQYWVFVGSMGTAGVAGRGGVAVCAGKARSRRRG